MNRRGFFASMTGALSLIVIPAGPGATTAWQLKLQQACDIARELPIFDEIARKIGASREEFGRWIEEAYHGDERYRLASGEAFYNEFEDALIEGLHRIESQLGRDRAREIFVVG